MTPEEWEELKRLAAKADAALPGIEKLAAVAKWELYLFSHATNNEMEAYRRLKYGGNSTE